jgi:NAD(P)-dependent dehydrogenase (short-subunit alcohol dehydrogenase family)
MTEEPAKTLPAQSQEMPGSDAALDPPADHGEHSYRGSGRLLNKVAIITGGDSGIGRAVAIAFAREGADLVLSYLNEEDDARETERWVVAAGRKCELVPGDISNEKACRDLVQAAVRSFGHVNILVNNAAYQMAYEKLDQITFEEFDKTFRTNVYAPFFLVRSVLPHMPRGGSIINTASINADKPNPLLIPYAATKGAIANLTASLAQHLAEKGIRVNSVAPGPIWTPLIPASFPPEKVEKFGANVPMKRPGQPAEVAPAFVLLASDEASYMSGAMVPVTGGTPIL